MQSAAWSQRLLGRDILPRKEGVFIDRNYAGACLNAPQGSGQRCATETGDIAVPPLMGQGDEVIGVLRQKMRFHKAGEKILRRGKAEPPPTGLIE